MAISNVTSILPDPPYIAALEELLDRLVAENARMRQDIAALTKGRNG